MTTNVLMHNATHWATVTNAAYPTNTLHTHNNTRVIGGVRNQTEVVVGGSEAAPAKYAVLSEVDGDYVTTGEATVRLSLPLARSTYDVVAYAVDWPPLTGEPSPNPNPNPLFIPCKP